jgi:hypothetical protein
VLVLGVSKGEGGDDDNAAGHDDNVAAGHADDRHETGRTSQWPGLRHPRV